MKNQETQNLCEVNFDVSESKKGQAQIFEDKKHGSKAFWRIFLRLFGTWKRKCMNLYMRTAKAKSAQKYTQRHVFYLKKEGFTLMEVMVALAIAAVALITATSTFMQSTRSSAHLEKLMAADLTARNLMDRYRIPYQQKSIPENEEESVTQAGFEMHYEQVITPAALEGLKKVDITVYDSDKKTVLRKLSMYAMTK